MCFTENLSFEQTPKKFILIAVEDGNLEQIIYPYNNSRAFIIKHLQFEDLTSIPKEVNINLLFLNPWNTT